MHDGVRCLCVPFDNCLKIFRKRIKPKLTLEDGIPEWRIHFHKLGIGKLVCQYIQRIQKIGLLFGGNRKVIKSQTATGLRTVDNIGIHAHFSTHHKGFFHKSSSHQVYLSYIRINHQVCNALAHLPGNVQVQIHMRISGL